MHTDEKYMACVAHVTHKKYTLMAGSHNRVRRQSGFPKFITAQRHYVRTSATRYRCGDNRTKVKTFCDVSMVSLVARWPVFWPVLDLRICSRTANPI